MTVNGDGNCDDVYVRMIMGMGNNFRIRSKQIRVALTRQYFDSFGPEGQNETLGLEKVRMKRVRILLRVNSLSHIMFFARKPSSISRWNGVCITFTYAYAIVIVFHVAGIADITLRVWELHCTLPFNQRNTAVIHNSFVRLLK